MMRLLLFLFTGVVGLTTVVAGQFNNTVEVGHVHWNRDFDATLEKSSLSGKPVLVLSQEVPGCAGC
jgi:hypothetical protein